MPEVEESRALQRVKVFPAKRSPRRASAGHYDSGSVGEKCRDAVRDAAIPRQGRGSKYSREITLCLDISIAYEKGLAALKGLVLILKKTAQILTVAGIQGGGGEAGFPQRRQATDVEARLMPLFNVDSRNIDLIVSGLQRGVAGCNRVGFRAGCELRIGRGASHRGGLQRKAGRHWHGGIPGYSKYNDI